MRRVWSRILLGLSTLWIACAAKVTQGNAPTRATTPAQATTPSGHLQEPSPSSSAATAPLAPSVTPIAAVQLPGTSGPVSVDYLACDRIRGRVWVPVGDTGSVDVLDIAAGAFTRVDGFNTEVREVRGKRRIMGPSSASVGQGFVYVGNRATNEVCAIDAVSLKLEHCDKLPAAIDGVAYVAATQEVWVTMPRDQALGIVDASRPDQPRFKQMVKVAGAPEGYALDESRGLFFTNLEDRNQTLVFDIKTRRRSQPGRQAAELMVHAELLWIRHASW